MYICSDIYVNNESYITNPEIQQYLQTNDISDDIPSVRASLYNTKLWPKDTILNVVFIKGEPWQRAWVEKVITEDFQPYCPIKFTFDQDGKKTIRVSFKESDGAYSAVGTDALNRSGEQATMNLGWLDAPGGKTSPGKFTFKGKDYTVPAGQSRNKNEVGATVLHEFGHAVGFIHEHQNPRGTGIEWDVNKVYKYFAGPPNNWDKSTIDRNILKKYDEGEINGSVFDPDSIMLYFFDAKLTKNNKGTAANHRLSDMDKQWLKNAYKNASPVKKHDIVETFSRNCENIPSPIINTNMATQYPFLSPMFQPQSQMPPQMFMPPQPQMFMPPQPQMFMPQQPQMSVQPQMPVQPQLPSQQQPIYIPIPIPSNNNRCDDGCNRKNCCKQNQNCCPPQQQNCCQPRMMCPPPPPPLPPPPPPIIFRPPPPPPPHVPHVPRCPPGKRRRCHIDRNGVQRCYCLPGQQRCPRGSKRVCRNLYGRVSCGPCRPIYNPPPNKIHIHGPGCTFGRRCARGKGHTSGRRVKGTRMRSDDEGETFRVVNNTRKIKGLGPGIVEGFDTIEPQTGIKINEKVTNVFNTKFLILITIAIIIAIVLYMMKERDSV